MFTFAHFSYDLNVLLSSEMEFPSSLLSTERAYIHRLVETWGYMSKSKGYEYCFMFLLVLSRDAPNFRPNLWPKTHFSVFGRNAFITETEIWFDANKKRGQHTLVWISANMSVVWTFFNVSEKDPRIAICKNCNALILMKLVHSHSHKSNGTRVVLSSINGINFETRSTAIFSVNPPLTLGDSVWQRANSR